METYDICMVGYGIATLSTLLHLSVAAAAKSLNIIIYDPFFDGGNLRRRYGQVISNTTWGQFLDAIEFCCPENLHKSLNNLHNRHEVTTLNELVKSILKVVNATSIKPNLRCEVVTTIKEVGDSWIINNKVKAKIVLLNYGSIPKSLNYCKPTLPLDAVLNGNPLPCSRGEKVMVFGTLHSGVLCINRLLYDAVNVIAVYKGDRECPFVYERDGAYDGLKNESATIADKLLKSSVHFINWDDQETINAQMESCNWVVYACGFTPDASNINVYNASGVQLDISKYDSTTGKICGKANLFGFGIAYPNSNLVDGTKYYDVSFPAFMKHIGANKNSILSYLEK